MGGEQARARVMVRSDNGDDNDRDHDRDRSGVATPESLLPTGYHHIYNR